MKRMALFVFLSAAILVQSGCASDGEVRMIHGEYHRVLREPGGQEYYVKDGRKYYAR